MSNKTLQDADKKGLHDWANQLHEDGRSRRKPQEAQWWENLATFHGDFWADYDLAFDKLVEAPKPDNRVRLPINLAQPAVRTEYAKLLKNRPIIDCLARSNEMSDLNAAEVGDKLLYNYIEKQLHMPKYRRRMLQWVVTCGAGGLFVDYNPTAIGNQEVLVDPNGQPVFDLSQIKTIQKYYRDKHKAPKTISVPLGELRHAALSPFQYMFDFSKLELDEAWWCIVDEVYDVDEVFSRWQVEVEPDSKSSQPGVLDERLLQRFDITKGMVDTSSNGTQDLCTIRRLFIRPGHRYFPDGAEIVYTEDQMIAAKKFPFKHNLLPIATCGHIMSPSSQYATGILPQIKPLVLEISKTESQLIENRNMMGNPPWMEYKQNRIKGEIQNKPGMRLTIDWMPNVPEPHPIQMPEMPAYVQALPEMLGAHILEVSGQSEVSQGKVPAGARAGVTIAYLQEEDDTKLGPTVQEYEECMERVAWLDIQVIAEKYDAPRTVRIFRKHGEPEVFDFIGTMLEGVAGVVCQAGSALPRSKAAKQQFILDLWDRKLEQDPRKVREMLELSAGEPDEWELDIQEAERENRRLASGNGVRCFEWQNHQAHHYQHRRFMKSGDWANMDPQLQEMYIQHDNEHSQFERQQQQRQMRDAAMQGQGGPSVAPSPGGPADGGANGVTATPDAAMQGQGTGAPGQGDSQNVQDYAPQ